jgi:hypothetical protein
MAAGGAALAGVGRVHLGHWRAWRNGSGRVKRDAIRPVIAENSACHRSASTL